MEFHPDKCQLLRITNKTKPILNDYFIHNIKLTFTNSAKYLGVTIDGSLKWTKHYNNICAKANSTLAFLQRNISGCPTDVKAKCVNTFVRPILEYGCCVWDPHHQKHIEQIEKIQRRAARFVTSNYTLIEGNTKRNMNSLNWVPLEERRAKSKLTTLFKTKLGAIDVPIEDLIVSQSKTRRKNTNYFVPQSSVDSHLHSFFPSSIRLWNSIPDNVKACNTIAGFKSNLQKITIKASYN